MLPDMAHVRRAVSHAFNARRMGEGMATESVAHRMRASRNELQAG